MLPTSAIPNVLFSARISITLPFYIPPYQKRCMLFLHETPKYLRRRYALERSFLLSVYSRPTYPQPAREYLRLSRIAPSLASRAMNDHCGISKVGPYYIGKSNVILPTEEKKPVVFRLSDAKFFRE